MKNSYKKILIVFISLVIFFLLGFIFNYIRTLIPITDNTCLCEELIKNNPSIMCDCEVNLFDYIITALIAIISAIISIGFYFYGQKFFKINK